MSQTVVPDLNLGHLDTLRSIVESIRDHFDERCPESATKRLCRLSHLLDEIIPETKNACDDAVWLARDLLIDPMQKDKLPAFTTNMTELERNVENIRNLCEGGLALLSSEKRLRIESLLDEIIPIADKYRDEAFANICDFVNDTNAHGISLSQDDTESPEFDKVVLHTSRIPWLSS